MPRYIDADALLDWAEEYYNDIILLLGIKNAPTADIAPVVHGEWKIKHRRTFSYHVCSVCGFNGLVLRNYNEYNYCPSCGARMKVVQAND